MVKVNYPSSIPDDILGEIYGLQAKLLEHYILIENMPSYPLNIHTKASQRLMKDFVSRGIEELSEAHEIYRLLFQEVDQNKSEGCRSLLFHFNEELSDALHFFVEALIFAGIDQYTLFKYYKQLFQGSNLEFDDNPQNVLGTAFYYANICNIEEYSTEPLVNSFSALPPSKIVEDPFLRGGNRVSLRLIHIQAELMWDITHQFYLATNHLKNNPWKQTEVEVDTESFKEQLFKGWLALINLLHFMGLDSETTYLVYFHKNTINHERIKSKR